MGAPQRLSGHPDHSASERRDPEVRRRLSAPAMRSFLNVCAAWDLGVNQQRGLLGWPAASTYHKYKALARPAHCLSTC